GGAPAVISYRRRTGPGTRRVRRGGRSRRPRPTGSRTPAGTAGHRGRAAVPPAPLPVPSPARSPRSPSASPAATLPAGVARRPGPDGHHRRDLRPTTVNQPGRAALRAAYVALAGVS